MGGLIELRGDTLNLQGNVFKVELLSKELNHFGVLADLFRQIGGHSSDLCYFALF